jgi:hypothetical protein
VKKLKHWLLLVVGVLVALILGVLVTGMLLPEEHHASRTLVIRQSPPAIWDAINDHASEPEWRSDVQSVTSLGQRDGKPVWREDYKDGNKLTLMTTDAVCIWPGFVISTAALAR